MNRKQRQRKHAQRVAHAQRRDNRQPDHPLTADERRNQARGERRRARKA